MHTGWTSHARVRLCSARRTLRIIHTARASSAGGQIQPRSAIARSPGANASRAAPVAAIAAAGTRAQRWGWSVQRVDISASAAHPAAKASSIAAVTTCSRAPGRTTRTSVDAPTRPRAIDPATMRAMGPDRITVGSGEVRVWTVMVCVLLDQWTVRGSSLFARTVAPAKSPGSARN